MKEKKSFFKKYAQELHPLSLILSLFLFAFGVSLSNYLGYQTDWTVYGLGQAFLLFILLSGYFLKAYYDAIKPVGKEPVNYDRTERKIVFGLLQVAITALTLGVVMAFLLFIDGSITPGVAIVMGCAFLLTFFYGVPPVRFVHSGYGELADAILIANIAPALGFLLQVGEFHRLISMLTFPLTVLFLAMFLSLSLKSYASDVKYGQNSLMARIGWERGMFIHNLLILCGYALFGIAALFDMPWNLVWPGLLSMPLGVFQIWQMVRISNGGKPQWRLLSITAVAIPLVTVYFLSYTLFTG